LFTQVEGILTIPSQSTACELPGNFTGSALLTDKVVAIAVGAGGVF
jgi:hypothetical protein